MKKPLTTLIEKTLHEGLRSGIREAMLHHSINKEISETLRLDQLIDPSLTEEDLTYKVKEVKLNSQFAEDKHGNPRPEGTIAIYVDVSVPDSIVGSLGTRNIPFVPEDYGFSSEEPGVFKERVKEYMAQTGIRQATRKILFAGDSGDLAYFFLDDSERYEPTALFEVDGKFVLDAYHPDVKELERLYDMSIDPQYEAVVIPNNMRAGVLYATSIGERLKDKMIVVWNDGSTSPVQDIPLYEAKGLKIHPTHRSDVVETLDRIL